MKRRRLSNRCINDLVLREAQRLRLVRIARGELEPGCEREGFFQWSLLEGHRPRYSDFILPPLLFLWEQAGADDDDAAGEAAADAALTAS